MLLRPLLRRGAAAVSAGGVRAPAARPDPPASLASLLLASRSYAKAKGGGKPAASTSNRGKVRVKDPKGVASEDASASGESAASAGGADEIDGEFEMPTDPLPPTYDPALDVGPGGRPLFAFTDTFASFSHRGANAYVDFTYAPILFPRPLSSRLDPNAVMRVVTFRCIRFVCQVRISVLILVAILVLIAPNKMKFNTRCRWLNCDTKVCTDKENIAGDFVSISM